MSEPFDRVEMVERLMKMLSELKAGEPERRDGTAVVVLDQSAQGRLSRMDAMQQQAMAHAAENRATLQVRRIEAALLRLQRNEFGYCSECGEMLAAGRLSADPCVVLCVPCAEEQAEQRPGSGSGRR